MNVASILRQKGRAVTTANPAAIPGSHLMILPNVGHFAMRQDPASYNRAIVSFLDGSPPPALGACH